MTPNCGPDVITTVGLNHENRRVLAIMMSGFVGFYLNSSLLPTAGTMPFLPQAMLHRGLWRINASRFLFPGHFLPSGSRGGECDTLRR